MDAGEAGVNEDTAFDGDATTGATAAGAAPDASTDTPDADGPAVDGGVVGGVPGRASVPGATEAVDATGDELPPEEHGR
jgi:hypothetical protein